MMTGERIDRSGSHGQGLLPSYRFEGAFHVLGSGDGIRLAEQPGCTHFRLDPMPLLMMNHLVQEAAQLVSRTKQGILDIRQQRQSGYDARHGLVQNEIDR